MMHLRQAEAPEFEAIRRFYWTLIDAMADQQSTIGWKKGIYPTDEFLQESLRRGELYVLEEGELLASVILNSAWNEGYEGAPWSLSCPPQAVLVPHALAVHAGHQGQGLGKLVVQDILSMAAASGKKTVRLDILAGNQAAEGLYTRMGFQFVQRKTMYYADTGWTDYVMYEYLL